jgi:hypothetical protein
LGTIFQDRVLSRYYRNCGAPMNEKICPFMSRPVVLDSVSNDTLTQNTLTLFEAVCIRERCMAWKCDAWEENDSSGIRITGKCRLIP